MKISQVSTAVVQANFDYTFVRVMADDETFGIGEAFFAPGLPGMIREIGSLLLGEDPRDIRTLLSRLHNAISASSGPGSSGACLHAVSGIETALWDLVGKLYGEPVWQLLGGRFRHVVPVYADIHAGVQLSSIDSLLRSRRPFWATPDGKVDTGDFYWVSTDHAEQAIEAVVERARAAADAGFGCVKLDIDVFEGPREVSDATLRSAVVSRIAERAAHLKESLGDSVEVAYDCHWRFDVPTARSLMRALAEADPIWLEDPVRPLGRALGQVAEAGPIAIASGENCYLLDGIQALATDGGLHVATPDVQKVGGILESQLIAEWTSRHGLGFAPHCIASPVGFAAAVHVMAAAPSAMFLEFHGSDLPFWQELVTEEVIDGGHAPVPDRPGLGVTLNMDAVRRYSPPGEPVFDEGPVR